MNWKEQLTELEHNKEYKSAINHIQNVIKGNPEDVEAYIRSIYLLHNILVEEDYSDLDHDFLASLLKSLFDASYAKFSSNSEYLFFIGKILYIAEWYFGVDDDFKATEEKQAFQMQKKAYEIERNNTLYEWAWRFSIGDKFASTLAEQILTRDKTKLEWLKSKGFPGEYILKALEQNRKQ
jgi:hypothetical protein